MKNKGIGFLALILIVFGAAYFLLNSLKNLKLAFEFDDEIEEDE